MASKKSGIQFNAKRDIKVKGDVIEGDKTVTYNSGLSARETAKLARQFAQIQKNIDQKVDDPQVDKNKLKETVENIEQEVKKGQEADPGKVKRWLGFLAESAEDIFQVTVATLANPVAGVAKAVQLIAQKAKEERSADGNAAE